MNEMLALPYYASTSPEYKHIKYRIQKKQVILRSKEWKSTHPDKIKESWTKYNNKSKGKRKAYYLNNKESISLKKSIRHKIYYELHKDEINKKHREYNTRNKERVSRYGKNWRDLNKFDVIFHYTNGDMCCVNCGENIYELLTIDHINGGGSKHRRKIESGSNFCLWLRRHNFPEGLQILCYNCNMIKQRVTPERYNEIVNELRSRKFYTKTISGDQS